MTSNKTRQYEDEQYKRTPDPIMDSGFTNYERLMVELNNREYYPKETYEKFLNENGLLAEDTFDKNTDHAGLRTDLASASMSFVPMRNSMPYPYRKIPLQS